MTGEKIKKKCLQYMKAQLEQFFDMDTASISSKSSNKLATIDDLEDSHDPAEDELCKRIVDSNYERTQK